MGKDLGGLSVTADREELSRVIGLMGRVTANKTPRETLRCVKLEAGDNGLVLTATDSEARLEMAFQRVEVKRAGRGLIPADRLRSILQHAKGSTVNIEANPGGESRITESAGTYEVVGPAVDPTFDRKPPKGQMVRLNGAELTWAINSVRFAVANEHSRYAINGVHVEHHKGRLELVTTDGHQLAVARISADLQVPPGSMPRMLLSRKFADTVLALGLDEKDQVELFVEQSVSVLRGEGFVLSAGMMEGNFPPHRDVIPPSKDTRTRVHAQVGELLSGVTRANLLTSEDSKSVRVTLGVDLTMKLSSTAAELGRSSIDVPLESRDGEPIEIGFNGRYLTRTLKSITEPDVSIKFIAPNKPAVIEAGENFKTVLMPTNL